MRSSEHGNSGIAPTSGREGILSRSTGKSADVPPDRGLTKRRMLGKLDTSFFDDGKCKNKMDLFFPPDSETNAQRDVREPKAKAVCARCPVKAPCREYGFATPNDGVLGGLTKKERNAIIRSRKSG